MVQRDQCLVGEAVHRAEAHGGVRAFVAGSRVHRKCDHNVGDSTADFQFYQKKTLTVYPISMSVYQVYPLGVVWIYLTLTEMLQCKGSLEIDSYDFVGLSPGGDPIFPKIDVCLEGKNQKRHGIWRYPTVQSHHLGIIWFILLKLMEYKKNKLKIFPFLWGKIFFHLHMGLSENRVYSQ